MTDIDSILDNATQWATESVTKPTIKVGQLHSLNMMSRGIIVKRVSSDDELIGVVDRHAYSIDSQEAWICGIVTHTSEDDLDNIVGCIKRIIAEYGMVDNEETYLNWAGGDYKYFNNIRFEFHFVIVRKKVSQTEF